MSEVVKCCGCQKPLVDRLDYFGTYVNDTMTEGVCRKCSSEDVRTKAQIKGQMKNEKNN